MCFEKLSKAFELLLSSNETVQYFSETQWKLKALGSSFKVETQLQSQWSWSMARDIIAIRHFSLTRQCAEELIKENIMHQTKTNFRKGKPLYDDLLSIVKSSRLVAGRLLINVRVIWGAFKVNFDLLLDTRGKWNSSVKNEVQSSRKWFYSRQTNTNMLWLKTEEHVRSLPLKSFCSFVLHSFVLKYFTVFKRPPKEVYIKKFYLSGYLNLIYYSLTWNLSIYQI